MAARTTLITAILLLAKRLEHDVEFGLLDRSFAAAAVASSNHHSAAAGGRLNAMVILQVIAQLFGLFKREANDLVAHGFRIVPSTRLLLHRSSYYHPFARFGRLRPNH